MNEQNPLQFFIDLVEENPIEALSREIQKDQHRSDFSIEDLIDENKDIKQSINGGADDLIAHDISGYWYSSYFVDNLPRKMLTEQSKALKSIDSSLANMPDLNLVFSKLTSLVNSLDESLKQELEKRKKRIVRPASHQSPPKIQWLGQVNVLGTLFYHLLKGQDGGAPYIAGSIEQVKRMLVDNFVDSEGYELSKGTLDTIFMPSRSEKRANEGDRIELPNKRVKK